MRIRFNCYKDGKHKAFTMSFDDGQVHDLRLVDIFNKYGIKGTFHLNSGKLDDEKGTFLTSEDVATKFEGHEISVHSLTHPFLERISDEEIVNEIVEDRKILEKLCGYPVRGMSYPFGTYTKDLIPKLRTLGMQYSRTVKSTGKFTVPEDFMEWHPTCHQIDGRIYDYLTACKENKYPMPLFYVWGHSYEFEHNDNWARIEEFGQKGGGNEGVWYATNMEIYDYIQAYKKLEFSVDGVTIHNPTAIDIYFECERKNYLVKAGETIQVD